MEKSVNKTLEMGCWFSSCFICCVGMNYRIWQNDSSILAVVLLQCNYVLKGEKIQIVQEACVWVLLSCILPDELETR